LGDDRLYEILAGWLLDLAKLLSRLAANGLEIAQRWQGSQRLLFLMNHTAQPKQVSLDTTFINLVDDTAIPPTLLTIPPRDVLVLLENT
jgi:hypothetical protein